MVDNVGLRNEIQPTPVLVFSLRDFQQINYSILWGGQDAIGVKLRKVQSCQVGITQCLNSTQ
ncbi:MAG: hypothetical protein V7L00_11610, partial [Nostoc sp.]